MFVSSKNISTWPTLLLLYLLNYFSMNYIEPTKDMAVIQKARDEMMMVAAKYDLTGCFYITQADNLASTE